MADAKLVDLRYRPRAGLLPELSRQTYDSLYKALREVALNGVDAGATLVEIDFSEVLTSRTLEVRDNGMGMTFDEFMDSFLALGGSSKIDDPTKFGRIGIGSLALLHYGERATVETKAAGADHLTVADLGHPWALSANERSKSMESFSAGSATSVRYRGDPADHFTHIRLHGVSHRVLEQCGNVSYFFELVEHLRRVLPLPFGDSPLLRELRAADKDLLEEIESHARSFNAGILIKSSWGDDTLLTKRWFGETSNEAWIGKPRPFQAHLTVWSGSDHRAIQIMGYLVSQARASINWSGITARVQNVAVEERSFFEVDSDPGFRKYISGEVFVLGDVDRAHLINIDRASFNRESPDYQTIRDYVARVMVDFKSTFVQQPRRKRAEVRKILEDHVRVVEAIRRVEARVHAWPGGSGDMVPTGQRLRDFVDRSLVTQLTEVGVRAHVGRREMLGGAGAARDGYDIHVAEDGTRLYARVVDELAYPSLRLFGHRYRVRLGAGRRTDAPVAFRRSPRAVVLNLAHPLLGTAAGSDRLGLALLLELAAAMADSQSDIRRVILELLAIDVAA